MVELADGITALETLQTHDNPEIYRSAVLPPYLAPPRIHTDFAAALCRYAQGLVDEFYGTCSLSPHAPYHHMDLNPNVRSWYVHSRCAGEDCLEEDVGAGEAALEYPAWRTGASHAVDSRLNNGAPAAGFQF
jgi:hypothetical protein